MIRELSESQRKLLGDVRDIIRAGKRLQELSGCRVAAMKLHRAGMLDVDSRDSIYDGVERESSMIVSQLTVDLR